MKIAPFPLNETERLNELKSYRILDTLPEQSFDDLTAIASHICNTPVALVSLLDESRQWFKSAHGLGAKQTHRNLAFCAHAILQEEVFVVEDSTIDERFAENPLVVGEPHVRFYAGAPLKTARGHNLGTLCVIDHKPRELSRSQLQALESLARQVVNQLELRLMLLESKRDNAEITQERDKAKDLARMKTEFIANVSHEIRTPMNGIIGMTQLLFDSKLDDDQKEKLRLIQNCGNSLVGLVNDILDLSKLEAGKIDLEMIPFGVKTLAEDTLSLFEGNTKQKGLKLSVNVASNVPAVVMGDRNRVKQILNNLVSNSIKFTSQGSIEIQITAVPMRKEGEFEICVAVRDSGIGIPLKAQESLFRAFSQANASIAREFGGSGLGLAISKGLCERMGGRIWLESAQGVGSTFSFTFLAHETTGVGIEKPIAATVPLPELKTKAMKILIAEDTSVNQKVILGYLRKLGYEADLVSNGLEALEALDQKNYDLILMDCHMPIVDGFEATRRIRKMYAVDRRPKIVALTASAMKEDREKCLACGMDAFISKPLRLKDLEDLLGRIL